MKVRLINQISGLTISKMKVLIRSYMTPNPLIDKEKAIIADGLSSEASLTDERCNYIPMIDYVTIRKLKG